MEIKLINSPEVLLEDFNRIMVLSDIDDSSISIKFERLKAGQHLPKFRAGNMVIYVFMFNGETLKVGKAGPRSKARFCSQHYSSKAAKSTLASSLLKDQDFAFKYSLNELNVGQWLKDSTERWSFFIEEKHGIYVLNLLESFLHCRLKPRYEGFLGQISH